MAANITARQTATRVNAALAKAGIERTVDAKRVRAWVRDHIDAYDDDGYTAHLYDERLAKRIVDGMVAARKPSGGRAAAASAGRNPAKAKPAAAPKRPRGTGSVPKQTMGGDQPA